MAKLPLDYNTEYPSISEQCDNCHKLLNEQDQCQILICGHSYHVSCYVSLEFWYHHCLKYFKKKI